ncbi:hypothetical protein D9M72_298190 [compost metagenome]
MAAAQQHGEVAGVEHFGNSQPGTGLASLQRVVLDGHIAGVEHVAGEVEGEGPQGGADGAGGRGGAHSALVAQHSRIAAETENDGGAVAGRMAFRLQGGSFVAIRGDRLPPAAVLGAVAVETAPPRERRDIDCEGSVRHTPSSPQRSPENQPRRRRTVPNPGHPA